MKVCHTSRLVLLSALMTGAASGESIVLSKGEIQWTGVMALTKLTIVCETADTSLTIHLNDRNSTTLIFACGSLAKWRENRNRFLRWHEAVMREEVTLQKDLDRVEIRRVAWGSFGRHSPATTAIVGASGSVNCPNCSCDRYNITRQGDSIFFEIGPGTEPDFPMGGTLEF